MGGLAVGVPVFLLLRVSLETSPSLRRASLPDVAEPQAAMPLFLSLTVPEFLHSAPWGLSGAPFWPWHVQLRLQFLLPAPKPLLYVSLPSGCATGLALQRRRPLRWPGRCSEALDSAWVSGPLSSPLWSPWPIITSLTCLHSGPAPSAASIPSAPTPRALCHCLSWRHSLSQALLPL